MRTTLAEAKSLDSGIAQAIGINACDARFVSILNRAQQRLSEMGKWWGTYRRMYVCATNNCIVWPREVATVEGVNLRQFGISLANQWYEFGDSVRAPSYCEGFGVGVGYDRGVVPQFAQFPWDEAEIRIYPTVAADAGAKVVIQGLDTNGNPVRTLVGSTYSDGEQITLASPFATSAFTYTANMLTAAQKPVTKGRLNVYAVHPDTGDEVRIAFWEPYERNPQYRRTFLPGAANNPCNPVSNCGVNGCDPAPTPACSGQLFEAIVRLEFLPALVDTDWLFISNIEAVKAGMKATEKADRNQYQEAEIEWATAKRILRAELDKYDPPDQIQINAQPERNAPLCRVFAGFR